MTNTLERVLRWVILGGIFVLPFIVLTIAHSLFFPFITGKNFLFRGIVELIGASWLALALVNPLYRPRRSWLLAAFALFVLAIGIADAFGADPLKSFWSNFERMEGWVTLAHLLVLFVVASSMLATERLWNRFWHTSVFVSMIVGGYGLLQLAGKIAINQGGVRLDATFGNATYLAVYMLFHVFITAMLASASWVAHPTERKWRMPLYGLIIALQALILFFTATRGAMLGLIGGVLLSALLLVLMARNSRVVWRFSVGTVVALLVLVGGFFLVKDQQWVAHVEPLQRLSSISLSDNTTKARFMNWGMAYEGFKERPILGWGQENYNLVFNKYYNPAMYGQEPWFDRVHNIFFDWLIAGGIVGLSSYLAVFLAALWLLWRREESGQHAFTVAERALLTGLFAGYFFNNLFVFDNITSYLMFVLVLAFIAARDARVRGAAPVLGWSLSRSALPATAAVAAAMLFGGAYWLNADALTANRALIQAISPQPTLSENAEYFTVAAHSGYLGAQEAREQLVQGAIRLAGSTASQADQEMLFTLASDEMEAQMERAPLDARFPLFLGSLHDTYGQYETGAAYLAKAHELSPTKQSIMFEQGINALLRGKQAEALAIFKEAFENEPNFVEARVYYAAAAIRAGETALADELVGSLVAMDRATDDKVIGAYLATRQYGKAVSLWQARLKNHPDDLQGYFSLAATYYAAGQPGAAVTTLRQVAEQFPQAAGQAEAYITQIQNGTI